MNRTAVEDLGSLIGFAIVVFFPLAVVIGVLILFGLIGISIFKHVNRHRSTVAVCVCGTPFRNGLCANCGAQAI